MNEETKATLPISGGVNWDEVFGVIIKAVIAWCVFRLMDKLAKAVK